MNNNKGRSVRVNFRFSIRLKLFKFKMFVKLLHTILASVDHCSTECEWLRVGVLLQAAHDERTWIFTQPTLNPYQHMSKLWNKFVIYLTSVTLKLRSVSFHKVWLKLWKCCRRFTWTANSFWKIRSQTLLKHKHDAAENSLQMGLLSFIIKQRQWNLNCTEPSWVQYHRFILSLELV